MGGQSPCPSPLILPLSDTALFQRPLECPVFVSRPIGLVSLGCL
jgi:hypothetical protein